jgi:two-component sensor histidine kinase
LLRVPARFHVLSLIAAVVTPVWLFAAYLLAQYAFAERARFESDARETAKQVGLVVEGELARLLTVIEGLAKSSAIESGDLNALYTETSRLVAGTDRIIILQDVEGVQLLNSRLPLTDPLPRSVAATTVERSTLAGGRPVVSGVHDSTDGFRISVSMSLPADRMLVLSVPTDHILSVMLPAVPEGWTLAIGDSDGNYVARSTLHDETTGKPGLPEYVSQVVGESGTFTSRNFQGLTLLAGYYRAAVSGWFYAANIPLSAVQAPLWRSIWAIVAIAAFALLVSGALAYFVGKRFTKAAEGLAARADALGRGLPVEPLSTSISEFVVIGDAMQDAERALLRRAREMEAVLETAPAAVWFTYDPLARQVIRNRFAADLMGVAPDARRSFGQPDEVIDTIASRDGHTIPREDRPLSRAMRGEFTDNEESAYTLLDGTQRVLLTSARPIRDPRDNVIGAVQVSLDITDRKKGEEQRKLLVNELNHRVKNSLAVVQAIATQTLRGAKSLSDAREALVGRLVSLGKAHDILTHENWSGADLGELVTAAISPHAQIGRFDMAGTAVWLEPNLAMSLALAFHELTTNATKYGSLSAPDGRVSITWTFDAKGEASGRLALEWRESGGPAVERTDRKGFGTRMMERMFNAGSGNSVSFALEPAGMVCRFDIKIDPAEPMIAVSPAS